MNAADFGLTIEFTRVAGIKKAKTLQSQKRQLGIQCDPDFSRGEK